MSTRFLPAALSTLLCLGSGLASGLLSVSAFGQDPEAGSLSEALTRGETHLQLRLRFEAVSDDAVSKDAHALTLRTALGYETRRYKGWNLFVEAENVTAVGNDLYDNAGAGSLDNGVRDRPVVADPALTEINQAGLRYTRGKTSLSLGRSELILGDHRWVGNVGWRQNHQSFDALVVRSSAVRRLTLTYAFLDSVHRIFGDRKPMDSHLLDARIDLAKVGTLTLYGYLLDFDRATDAAQSRDTWGAELEGEAPIGGIKLLYEAEYARQRDAGNNPRHIDAGYRHLQLGAGLGRVTVRAGFETLEGDARDGQLSTPLATLHKLNGWADKFLVTPPEGLEDLYLSVQGEPGPIGWTVVYHRFDAESADRRYGDELDLQLTYRTPWKQEIGFKGAFYDGETFAADTDKLILWTSYSF